MQYEEWLNILEELKTSSTNIDTLKRMQNADVNPNFNNMLVPKLEELIRLRKEKAYGNQKLQRFESGLSRTVIKCRKQGTRRGCGSRTQEN